MGGRKKSTIAKRVKEQLIGPCPRALETDQRVMTSSK